MDLEDAHREFAAVQRRYDHLQLTYEQAEQVFLYEQESEAPIRGALSFTFWEEREYEWDRMKAILTPEQLPLYERDRQQSIDAYEASLRKMDAAEWPVEIAIFEEMIAWYGETFIPGFRREALQVPILLFVETEKIVYLRAEYKKFLQRTRRDALVNHYRQSRSFQPNALRLALLRQHLLELWPDFARWYREADGPTQTVAAFVLERYQGYCRQGSAFFQEKEEAARHQWANIRTRHTGEATIRGWHVPASLQPAWSVEELGMMALVLMEAK
ncbi:MAG TPA: hypothetical protein VGM30_17475 [Puia sp.]|jgi:hypothetical protein